MDYFLIADQYQPKENTWKTVNIISGDKSTCEECLSQISYGLVRYGNGPYKNYKVVTRRDKIYGIR